MWAEERKEKATAIAHSEAIGGIIFGREGARGGSTINQAREPHGKRHPREKVDEPRDTSVTVMGRLLNIQDHRAQGALVR